MELAYVLIMILCDSTIMLISSFYIFQDIKQLNNFFIL